MLTQWSLKAFIKVNQCSGYSVTYGPGLTSYATTHYLHSNIVLTQSICDHKGLFDRTPVVNKRE